MGDVFSLTPGFSPVLPLKRLVLRVALHTRLKPGVNEISQTVTRFCELQ